MRFVTNPMIVKELRQRLRERRSWLVPILYLLVLAGAAAYAYFLVIDVTAGRTEIQGADIGNAIFLTVVFSQLGVLLIMAPVFSAGSLTIEKEQRTLAGLLTSLLSIPQIWWGKFIAAILYLLLLLLSALPVLALALAFGGVDPRDLFLSVGATILVLASISTIGLWCSSVFRRSVHSTASCYAIVLVMTIVTAVVSAIMMARWADGHAEEIREYGFPFSVQTPALFNPIYPFIRLMNVGELERAYHPVASWVVFTGVGLLCAGLAMRRLRNSGEQL